MRLWPQYLQHNWGTSPKMKAAEKKYNAKYYQQHKDKWGVGESSSGSSKSKKSSDSGIGSTASKEIKEANRLNDNAMKYRGQYDDEVLKNVNTHNYTVADNIDKLTETVSKYLNDPSHTADQKKKMIEQYEEQVKKAHGEMLDLDADEGRAYLEKLGAKRKSSESSAKSTKSSSKRSKSSSKSTSKKPSSTRKTSTKTSTKKTTSKKKAKEVTKVSAEEQKSINNYNNSKKRPTSFDELLEEWNRDVSEPLKDIFKKWRK